MLSTRRAFLAGAAATLAAPALAKAPIAETTTPIYRMKLGDFEVTALSDGYLDAPRGALNHIERAELDRLLAKDFRPAGDTMRLDVNAFVVNTGDKLVLIDAGTVNGFAPSLAHMTERLAAAGFKPEDFDAIAMTHLHADHVGALTDNGAARFTKAEFLVHANELKFWLDDGIMSRAKKEDLGFFQAARGAATPDKAQTRAFDKDGEIVKGVSAVALPGHTPGHTGYLISSGNEQLLIWGDIVHMPAVQFARPEAYIAFDVDPDIAVATRKKILDRVSADKLAVAGAHMSFPAFSHIEVDGSGYRAQPLHWGI